MYEYHASIDTTHRTRVYSTESHVSIAIQDSSVVTFLCFRRRKWRTFSMSYVSTVPPNPSPLSPRVRVLTYHLGRYIYRS